jgi:hypothetical protein
VPPVAFAPGLISNSVSIYDIPIGIGVV